MSSTTMSLSGARPIRTRLIDAAYAREPPDPGLCERLEDRHPRRDGCAARGDRSDRRRPPARRSTPDGRIVGAAMPRSTAGGCRAQAASAALLEVAASAAAAEVAAAATAEVPAPTAAAAVAAAVPAAGHRCVSHHRPAPPEPAEAAQQLAEQQAR